MTDVVIDGLDGEVEILRDDWGIPHVHAGSEHDVFVGQGFAQAMDRLGQLEYDRRRAHGTWAEIAGSGAAGFDVFARRCGLADAAKREYEALSQDAQHVLDAFADGVNAYLSLDRPLPPDLQIAGPKPAPWSPWDCCAVFLVRHVAFANWQKKLWRGRLAAAIGAEALARLEGTQARETPLIVPPGSWWQAKPGDDGATIGAVVNAITLFDPGGGSNAWALAGSRTASGRPLLAGDPHRLVEVPGVYAQCRLKCPELDAAGLSFVGVPGFPHFGQAEHVAWCVTNANGDYQDLYVERFDDDAARYEAAGEWLEPVRRVERIAVRDAESIEVECLETRNGPVVFGDPHFGYAIALRSTALVEPSPGASVLAPMLRARSVDELDQIMSAWVDPANNFVSADRDGNIAYRTVGRIPVRAAANAWGPVPGWDDEYQWRGHVPYDEMPHARNPDTGLIVTANQRIVDDDYPHYLGLDYASPSRALRLHDRLDDAHDVRADDMPAVHGDRISLSAEVWTPRLLRLDGRDEYERAALDALHRWDGVMDRDAVGAAVYMTVRDAVGGIVAHEPRLARVRTPAEGEPRVTFMPLELRLWSLLTGLLARDDTMLLPEGRGWDDVLTSALTDGVALLRTTLGDDPTAWRWGALHRCAPMHPLSMIDHDAAARLNPPSVEMGGETDTVFHSGHPAGLGFMVTTASVARYVFDLAAREHSRWIVPLGASGDATSDHFADQQVAWANGEVVPIVWDRDALADNGGAVALKPSG